MVLRVVDRLMWVIERTLAYAFIQGLTHLEVAEREGIPLGTAKTRIRTALLRLRSSLELDLSDAESTGLPGVSITGGLVTKALTRCRENR